MYYNQARFVGQAVKTPPSHGGNTGSIPVRTALREILEKVFPFFHYKKAGVRLWQPAYISFFGEVIMEKYIDLHVHSSASDGTLTPSQVVALAEEKKLKAFALTDHDTTAGLEEALLAAEDTSVEVIPGIELSTTWLGRDVHIVGLDIDYKNYYFQETLSRFQDSREIRNEKIMDLLRKEGISITREAMEESFPDSVWTRAHFARYLLDRGFVGSINQAFDRYLGDHSKCYVPREKVTPFQAVQLIHEGGGIAVFAHPILCRLDKDRLESLTAELKQAGLDGIEAYYSTYRHSDEQTVIQIAKRQGLALSGGSDFHGSNKPQIELGTGKGNLKIPYQLLENLRRRNTQRR